VIVAVLVLDLLREVGDVFLLMFTRFSCSLSNLLVSNASSSSPST
jgi:hypothetical protein